MKKKNGFTLVELLAVIVVLAIIMVIAIPNVLDAMNKAKKQSFILYMQKVVKATTEYYLQDSVSTIQGAGYYVYDIATDIGQSSHGSFEGYVLVDASDVDNIKYVVYLRDPSYMVINHNTTDNGYPSDVSAYRPAEAEAAMSDAAKVCSNYTNGNAQCVSPDGKIIQ